MHVPSSLSISVGTAHPFHSTKFDQHRTRSPHFRATYLIKKSTVPGTTHPLPPRIHTPPTQDFPPAPPTPTPCPTRSPASTPHPPPARPNRQQRPEFQPSRASSAGSDGWIPPQTQPPAPAASLQLAVTAEIRRDADGQHQPGAFGWQRWSSSGAELPGTAELNGVHVPRPRQMSGWFPVWLSGLNNHAADQPRSPGRLPAWSSMPDRHAGNQPANRIGEECGRGGAVLDVMGLR